MKALQRKEHSLVNQSHHIYEDLITARRRTGQLWAVTLVLTVLYVFFNMYFVDLERTMTKHVSGVFVKWPLPHYVNHHFLDTIACGVAFLTVIVIVLWIAALISFKNSPALADVERYRESLPGTISE